MPTKKRRRDVTVSLRRQAVRAVPRGPGRRGGWRSIGIGGLLLDPPDHTRLRALVRKVFAPKAVNALETRIRGVLGGLLDEIDDPAAYDLMQAVAWPLPVIVSEPGYPSHTYETPSRMDQRLRRTPAGHDPSRALACGLSQEILHCSSAARQVSATVPGFLQRRSAASGVPNTRPDTISHLLGTR